MRLTAETDSALSNGLWYFVNRAQCRYNDDYFGLPADNEATDTSAPTNITWLTDQLFCAISAVSSTSSNASRTTYAPMECTRTCMSILHAGSCILRMHECHVSPTSMPTFWHHDDPQDSSKHYLLMANQRSQQHHQSHCVPNRTAIFVGVLKRFLGNYCTHAHKIQCHPSSVCSACLTWPVLKRHHATREGTFCGEILGYPHRTVRPRNKRPLVHR